MKKETMKAFRETIKKEFPKAKGWKFSITSTHNTINIAILEAPINFGDGESKPINHYWINEHVEDEEQRVALNRIMEILYSIEGHYDRNAEDLYADYCDCNYYISLEIGFWSRPFKHIK